jgi:mono/diheme cytochrome c family protein
LGAGSLLAQGPAFRNAPASAAKEKNPFTGNAEAAAGGKKIYNQNCAQCHGNNLQGMGPAPTLISDGVKNAVPGDLFWFITNGDLNKGMPGWPQLPKQQRWQVVTYIETRNNGK